MEEIISFQKSVGELLIDLSLFVNKINPNPIVSIAAIDILEGKISNQYIFNIEYDDPVKKITSKEVRELYNQLSTFFKELDLYDNPDVIIAALEITKYQFIRELERLERRR